MQHDIGWYTTLGQLRDIPGIGDKKLEHYGDELLALITAAGASGSG
ncbi:HRDC domain-containing protein, partial [Bradyrhizobium sp.]